VATRAASVDADAFRVEAKVGSVETHVPHRARHIGVRLRDVEPRAAPVTNGEDRKSLIQERLVSSLGLLGVPPPRDPSAAHHIEDRGSVGRSGSEDVQGESHPGLMPIDQVRHDGVTVLCL